MRPCFLLFLSTVVYAVTRIVEVDFEGVNFAKALFGKRVDKVFQESAVDSETSCQIQCLKHIRCLSYNLGTINEKGSSATLIDLQVMKTLHKMKNGFTGEWS